MNLCSFYLWGVLKDTVYGNYPYFEDVLKEKIQNVGFSVSPEEIWSAMNNMFVSSVLCLQAKGNHFHKPLLLTLKLLEKV